MLLVEARKNDLTLHNMNNVDLFNLLEILLDKSKPLKETKKKAISYTEEHKVEKKVIMTVAGTSNCKIDYNKLSRKGETDMCTVFEETRAEGLREGTMNGRLTDIKNLMDSLQLTAEQAMDALKIPKEERASYLEKL